MVSQNVLLTDLMILDRVIFTTTFDVLVQDGSVILVGGRLVKLLWKMQYVVL